ncbi:MAG: hypothetical protein ACPLYX_12085 [Rectinema subterraneum]|uniref:hypothetical protein n=1 Tax=Rectinema subterraneum TaxID=2653714 RepID=UPI003C7A5314
MVEGKIIDLVRADGELVEIQTSHLSQLKSKVFKLAEMGYRVRVVYPVSVSCELHRLDPMTNELLSVRRSPKRGDIYCLFDELVRAPELVAANNITFEVLLIRSIEIKTRDGSGSWWRKGDRTVDKELAEVLSSRSFDSREQWLAIIPESLAHPWDSAVLAESLGISSAKARKILYCFCRAGIISELGKKGRFKTYEKLSMMP